LFIIFGFLTRDEIERYKLPMVVVMATTLDHRLAAILIFDRK